MKKSLQIKDLHQDLEIGDNVILIDGSALTLKEHDQYDEFTQEYIIIREYPEVTGNPNKLKDIVGTVKEINIQDYISPSEAVNLAYRQDIIVQIGKALFRTASRLVKKIN